MSDKKEEYPIDFIEALKLASALNWSPEKDKNIYEIFGLTDPTEQKGE